MLREVEHYSKRLGSGTVYTFWCNRPADESVVSRALIGIDRWLWRFNRTFPVPTTHQLVKLSSALEECADHLDEKTREQLWFCMKGF